MDQFIIKWASKKEVMTELLGHVLACKLSDNRDELTIVDAFTGDTLIHISNVLGTNVDNLEVRIDYLAGGIVLIKIPVPSNKDERFKVIGKNDEVMTLSKRKNNVATFTFDHGDVTMEEFIKYLISHDYISNDTKHEPGNILISRSPENKSAWIFREEFISK